MISRTAIAIYPRVPIFGRLRAAVAVLRKGDLILMIERADGRGFSFPGGLAFPWEPFEKAMQREVKEETGLQTGNHRFLFEYKANADIPCRVAVFEAEATGELSQSWEGAPHWRSLDEIRASIMPSQLKIVERLSSVDNLSSG